LRLASAITSLMFFAGSEGCETISRGCVATSEIGEKSRIVS